MVLFASSCASDGNDALDLPEPEQSADSATSTDSTTTTATSSTTTATTPTTTATTVTTVTTTEPDTSFPDPSDGEVFDEYIASQLEGFAAAFLVAAANPTPTPEVDYPDLAIYGADNLLQVNYDRIKEFSDEGIAIRQPLETAVGDSVDEKNRISSIVEIDGDSLTVFQCWIDDEDVVDAATEEVQISGVITALAVVTMQRFEDGWKAVFSEVTQKFEGVNGCFLASDVDFPY